MAPTVFKTSGFRELENTLLELSTATAKRYGRKSLKDAGKPILEDYKAGTTVKSGHLVESELIGERSKLNRRQKRLTDKPGPSEIEMHIGTADPAGIQEEFGHRQAANPALTRAWDRQGGKTALRRIGKSLGASIERGARRGRPKKG